MYVILTSKPGQFRTETVDGMTAVESYDYVVHGRLRARFAIASLERPVKVRMVDDGTPPVVNLVPSKFLPSFDTLEAARAELRHLTHSERIDARLVRTGAEAATR